MPCPVTPERIAFVLLPRFPLSSLVPAIEALRLANQNSGQLLYDWCLLSVDGGAVPSADGWALSVHGGLRLADQASYAFVCDGDEPASRTPRRLLQWLRRLSHRGTAIGSIHGGVFALAAAGLLEGREVTLHWEKAAEFRWRYPGIVVREQLFIIDDGIVTCAGGHSTLDMVLDLIRLRHGLSLAQTVANGFVAARPRAASVPQRELRPSITCGNLFERIIQRTERDPSAPVSISALAAASGADASTIRRAFREACGDTPVRHLAQLRLDLARKALLGSNASVLEIAHAHGFVRIEVFSRAFKSRYGVSPRMLRKREQNRVA